MFEISQLKEKKLTDLQEIAKKLNVPKYRSMKKLDLVYQILDQQAADPKAVKAVVPEATTELKTEKPARKPRQRVQKPVKKEQPQAKENKAPESKPEPVKKTEEATTAPKAEVPQKKEEKNVAYLSY